MKLQELCEGIAKEFSNFGEWSAATKTLGAVSHTKSGDKRKIFATSDLKKPSIKAVGEWDEKDNKRVVYTIRRPLSKSELAL